MYSVSFIVSHWFPKLLFFFNTSLNHFNQTHHFPLFHLPPAGPKLHLLQMDRLVKVDIQELKITFKPNQRCTTTFKLTNLMHTMSVAVSLTTTNPSLYSFSHSFSVLPPLSSSTPFSLHLSQPSDHPPLTFPSDSILVRTSMLPTGKASQESLRRLFTRPGPHVFKDATIPITFVGDHVVEFLVCPPPNSPHLKTLEVSFLLSKAISMCTKAQINTLLRICVMSGNCGFVSALIDAGGDVNDRDSEGSSLLSIPARAGNFDLVKVLVDSGCRFDGEIDLLLHKAVEMNRVDLLEILCRNGDSVKLVNSVNSVGRTPVHVSAANGNLDALRFCIANNGDPDCVDHDGWTPLHCAAAEGHTEVVEFLLEHCLYSKYAINKDGKTPFSVAVDNGQEDSDLLGMLHLNDALHRAARLDDVNTIKSCIAQGGDVNGRDQNGWTPLHRAAFKGRLESVKALLSHGAQVDLVDDLGYTPLHCAIKAGHTLVAVHLIAHGAKGSLKSLQGVSPLILEQFKGHPASISPLCGTLEQT